MPEKLEASLSYTTLWDTICAVESCGRYGLLRP